MHSVSIKTSLQPPERNVPFESLVLRDNSLQLRRSEASNGDYEFEAERHRSPKFDTQPYDPNFILSILPVFHGSGAAVTTSDDGQG